MRGLKRLLALVLALLAIACAAAQAAEDGFSSVYTYNYDYWGEVRESPNAYRADQVVFSATLDLEKPMLRPQSLFAQGNDLYVVDTGNNRILQLRRGDGGFSLTRIIDQVNGAEPAGFDAPGDVFVDEKGSIYVADTNHNRVVLMDRDLNLVREYVKPEDSTFEQNLSFLPSKVVADVAGRVYALATNVNKGLVKYEADGTFTGFIGANQVTYDLWNYIWKTYFMTKEQRSQQAAFVPTEYQNVYIDHDGFIYATNIAFSEYDLLWDGAKPIRRLNAVGGDILIKNDRYPPIGDLDWVEGSNDHGPSKLYDITVLDNDMYMVIDHTRGRIFGYDPQGIMLWAFGMSGVSAEGAFNSAVSIEHIGKDLIVLDELDCSVTVFTPTEYGNLIYQASEEYLDGKYEKSAETWKKVLQLNANYNLAFIGIGRAEMRAENYKEAMDLFKMAHDRDNYGRAFRYYRKEWVEQNIWWVVVIILVLVAFFTVRKTIRKVKWEVEAYEHNKVAK